MVSILFQGHIPFLMDICAMALVNGEAEEDMWERDAKLACLKLAPQRAVDFF